MAVKWTSVIASQRSWIEQVCRYLDDWSPPPPGMSADRASAFAAVWEGLLSYACDNGESLRTVFRQALYLDIHRRFIHLHGHDVDDGPLELYGQCRGDPALGHESWGSEPLATTINRRVAEFVADSGCADPDPDVMTAEGTSDLQAIVALAEHRRTLVRLLESDDSP